MRIVEKPRIEEVSVPVAVRLEGMSGAVEVVAVELGGEVVLAPDEVDFVAGDPLVRFRAGQWVYAVGHPR